MIDVVVPGSDSSILSIFVTPSGANVQTAVTLTTVARVRNTARDR